MNPIELRAATGLAGLYALRMLGMFLILPVFAVYAGQMPGGENHALVGLAFGAFGLTQALLQLPAGMWSDRIGRKPVIYLGLTLFLIGSLICAASNHIGWMIVGRAVQGAGAISAAVTALLADLTKEEHRTRAMAMIGGSIATTFALSLVLAPKLVDWIGLPGIFLLTAGLTVAALLAVRFYIPDPVITRFHSDAETSRARLPAVLRNSQLLRLNYGVFALHAAQMAMFTVMPLVLNGFGLDVHLHWQVYLPLVLAGFVLMVPAIIYGEKKHHLKGIFVLAVALMLLAQIGMALWLPGLGAAVLWLGIYFVAFNILEATQPSLISKIAPADAKGTAMGVYNTCQSLSMFVGGAFGGWIYTYAGAAWVFAFCAALVAVWLWLAASMTAPLPVKTVLLHLSENSHAGTLSDKLRQVEGVVEVVVLAEENAVLLKVLQAGWDEANVNKLIEEKY